MALYTSNEYAYLYFINCCWLKIYVLFLCPLRLYICIIMYLLRLCILYCSMKKVWIGVRVRQIPRRIQLDKCALNAIVYKKKKEKKWRVSRCDRIKSDFILKYWYIAVVQLFMYKFLWNMNENENLLWMLWTRTV